MNTKTRTLAWSAMALLALYVAAYAVAILADPAWRSPFVRDLLARQNLAAIAHFCGGGIALLEGALQINARVRRRLPLHRWLGRIYVVAVLISGIAGLGFIVWGHHMFQSGMDPRLGTGFMIATIMIALPSAVKVFNWLATVWGANIQFTTAMLFALGFV